MAGGITGHGLGRRRRLGPSADINVTSLVDVAFVLLIIFMITAPIMQGGVEVELPRASTRPLTARDAVIVTVDRQSRLYVDETRLTFDEFQSSIRAIVARKGASVVYIRGDRRVAYGQVVRVLSVLQRAGLAASIITEEEEISR